MPSEIRCHYCKRYKPPDGFIRRTGSTTRDLRNQCKACQEIRKRPRDELQALADREKSERKTKHE